jgi:hypothetical protein
MNAMLFLLLVLSSVSCAAELPQLSDQDAALREKLLQAPTQLSIAGVTIAFEAEAYLNLMPGVVMPPGYKVDCTKAGRFIVPIRLQVSSAVPNRVVIDAVWVHSNGKWWSGTFNRDERNGLAMIARGCPTEHFASGDLVDVIIRVQSEQRIEYLRALPKRLKAAI